MPSLAETLGTGTNLVKKVEGREAGQAVAAPASWEPRGCFQGTF